MLRWINIRWSLCSYLGVRWVCGRLSWAHAEARDLKVHCEDVCTHIQWHKLTDEPHKSTSTACFYLSICFLSFISPSVSYKTSGLKQLAVTQASLQSRGPTFTQSPNRKTSHVPTSNQSQLLTPNLNQKTSGNQIRTVLAIICHWSIIKKRLGQSTTERRLLAEISQRSNQGGLHSITIINVELNPRLVRVYTPL